jgi:calcineurin-like phosphoesterase
MNWDLSLVYWTHTHMQTNDEVILENGTWIISDVWMVWPFPSVIWADFNSLKKRFLTGIWRWKIEQSLTDKYVVNWLFVNIEDRKCVEMEKIRVRNSLV